MNNLANHKIRMACNSVIKKSVLVFSILFSLIFSLPVSAESTNYNVNLPYYSYTYGEDDKAIQIPAPYSSSLVIKGSDLGIDDFKDFCDVFYDSDAERIYLTDKGSGRIIILNGDFELVKEISQFEINGRVDKFNSPGSVCVRHGKIYVADTGNSRIVVLNSENYGIEKILDKPDVKLFNKDYKYSPGKIAVDLAGRIYVIASDINDGIFLLDQNGEFVRFVAAPDVNITLWNKFLKLFMTKAQKARLEKAVPTEYSSFLMDENGFLYLTSSDSTVHPITKLNSQGTDILDFEEGKYPDGDASHLLKKTAPIVSTFVDIAVRNDGIYCSLDTVKGRVFVYNNEGKLLYCFGGIGMQNGTFYSPSGIEIYGDKIIVSDSFYGTLTVFTRTEFGTSVDEATSLMSEGKYGKSQKCWNDVLRFCPGYELAELNLARIDIQNGDYGKALERLKGSKDFSYYSKAFKGNRKQLIRNNFKLLVIGLVIFIALVISWNKLKKRLHLFAKLENNKFNKELHYSNYTMFHPFDGYWDLKREKMGSLAAANTLVGLFVLAYCLRVQFSGYLFTGQLPSNINALYEAFKIIVPLGLWIVSNWCFTTLMEGEGTMRDIYIATAYSLKPYIITAIPLWLLSHCLAEEEAFIYTAFSSIVVIWTLALIFFGMMVTHDYSLTKAVITAVLTIIGICLIFFIALTFTNIIQKLYDFIADIYKEFAYRIT